MAIVHRCQAGLLVLFVTGSIVIAQDTKFPPQGDQIPGPYKATASDDWRSELDEWMTAQKGNQKAWLEDIRAWRREKLIRIGFEDSQYRRPEFLWTQRNFVSPQSMVEDRFFYDVASGKYTVDRFLDDLKARYGGIDSVLLWPVYPNIGIDNRSQWDLTRDLPAGVRRLREVVQQFHQRGVRVLFPAMPWDTGTRDPGVSHAVATAKLMAEIGADGVNGDTFSGVPRSYRIASDETDHPVSFEPELAPQSDEGLMWNNMSWAYWKFPFVPMVSKAKWIEPRHMEHVSDRWARDKTDDLQYAFFNGLGYVSWENVWGIWNGITPRDSEALRRVAAIERAFPELLVSIDWEPFYPTLQFGVYSTRFPGKDMSLWTVVNRNEYDVAGLQLEVPQESGTRFYDLWHGVEVKPVERAGKWTLNFEIEAHGFGAVLTTRNGAEVHQLSSLLTQMKEWSRKPLSSYSHEWHFLPQRMADIAKTATRNSQPDGMIRIPGATFEFAVTGVEIEGFDWIGLDVQYPWEDAPRRSHRSSVEIQPFFIDKFPVTNADFKRFLDASNYRPDDDHNFLKDWNGRNYPDGWDKRPVTWVSLEDARAYAKWAGKRLPHEWEWQYAAQGTDGRLYPWGNTLDDKAIAAPQHGRDLAGASDVDAHPRGASPFGVMDLIGNVWQWTDEFTDDHTRAAIVRGGSYYRPSGSLWYFPRNTKLNEHGKYLLMAPSKDRAGTLGFRCVADAS
jgi:formylglycine-generating enzyme required for sulfatase activity